MIDWEKSLRGDVASIVSAAGPAMTLRTAYDIADALIDKFDINKKPAITGIDLGFMIQRVFCDTTIDAEQVGHKMLAELEGMRLVIRDVDDV